MTKSADIASSIFTTTNTPSAPSPKSQTAKAQTGSITGLPANYSKQSNNLKRYRLTHYRCGICGCHHTTGYWVYRRHRGKLEKVFSCEKDLAKYVSNYEVVGVVVCRKIEIGDLINPMEKGKRE